jgi:hypothetical protein
MLGHLKTLRRKKIPETLCTGLVRWFGGSTFLFLAVANLRCFTEYSAETEVSGEVLFIECESRVEIK